MAGEESLKLAAEIIDKASPALKDIQRSLRSLSATASETHNVSTVHAKTHTEALFQLRRQVTDVADRMKGALSPALGTLGISSLSAAAGLAAVAAAMKEFAGSARRLEYLHRQTQLSVEQLRTLEALAPRIGSSVEEMDSALVQFNANMEKLRRAPLAVLRETFEHLNVRPDPAVVSGWRNLVGSLQGLPREQQLGKIVEYLSKIRDISQKGVVLEAFGLPKAFANLSPKELQEQLDRIHKILTPLTPEQEAAGRAFADAMDDVALSLKNLRDVVGGDLSRDLRGVADSITEFTTAHSQDVVASFREMLAAAKEFVTGIGLVVKALDDLRNEKPIDIKALVDFAGLDKTFEVFIATWKARWAEFKSFLHLGDQGAADALEAERQRLLRKDFPDQAEREERERRDEQEKGLKPALPFAPRWPVPPSPISPEREMPPAPAKPAWWQLWKRSSLDMPEGSGPQLTRAAFQVPGDWAGKLSGGVGGDIRGAVEVVRAGVYAGLKDFAADQQAGAGGGGGGAAGGSMSAIRAAYSPSGGGGGGGLGEPAGEPSATGGAGVGGTVSSPMGGLGSGGTPVGIEQLGGGLNRDAYNKMFAGTPLAGHADDVIKAARENGVSPSLMAGIMAHETGRGTAPMLRERNNPAGLMHGSTGMSFGSIGEGITAAGKVIGNNFRRGGSTIEGMAKSYAPVGAANDPGGLNAGWPAGVRRFTSQLEGGSAAPPRFGLADIRSALAGTGGDTGYTGVGQYNFMGSALAREMGMGDVTHGGPLAHLRFPTGIPRGEGPTSILANKYAGTDMAGFLKDLHAAGAPLKQFAGAYVNKPLQHGYGNALDIETGFGSGPNNSPLLWKWAQEHQKEFAEIQARHHMRNLDTTSGARMHDWGHFEWTPTGRAPPETESAVAGMHGDQLKRHFGVGKRAAHPDLLSAGQRAGLVGSPMTHKVEGRAGVDITLSGFPKGTMTKTRSEGMFKEVKLNRGRALPPASQEA